MLTHVNLFKYQPSELFSIIKNFPENLKTTDDNYSTINPYESSDDMEKQYIRSLYPNIRSEKTGDEDGLRLLQGSEKGIKYS